ncbi:MAG TPA: hypothetical protein VG248_15205 [Caulobacteraceae bacterium]|jgi:hypothetical protein|nr:hypothetical protein [Caulobacteraceae bacterium]
MRDHVKDALTLLISAATMAGLVATNAMADPQPAAFAIIMTGVGAYGLLARWRRARELGASA